MKKDKKIRNFFIKLLSACEHHDAYSVVEICSYFGVVYAQVKKWAIDDERWLIALEFCHMMCASNIDRAGLLGRLSVSECVTKLHDL